MRKLDPLAAEAVVGLPKTIPSAEFHPLGKETSGRLGIMLIRAGYEISYQLPQPTPMIFMLSIHPSRFCDLVTPHQMKIEPPMTIREYRDGFGNLCGRIVAPTGTMRISNDFIIKDSGEPDLVAADAEQNALDELPDEVLVYLLGSRYCETDRLSETVWSLFGKGPKGWTLVQTICDYVNDHIKFGGQHARPTKTASDTLVEGAGVCRDFAHLAITFCRCMNIPARYCAGYLGNIGVTIAEEPIDFTAWFEVYLGDRWYVFDARHNTRRIGRILMARGRDATDVALVTSFGPNRLTRFNIFTQAIDE
jgi:transglutaminase-like putative cysteine protease